MKESILLPVSKSCYQYQALNNVEVSVLILALRLVPTVKHITENYNRTKRQPPGA